MSKLAIGTPHFTVSLSEGEGCSGGGDETPRTGSGGTNDPLYVVFSTVEAPDGRIRYFATTPSIEAIYRSISTRGSKKSVADGCTSSPASARS